MKKIKRYSFPPEFIKESVKRMFSQYSHKNFQLKKIGIKKEEMTNYLWSTLTTSKGAILLVLFEGGKVLGITQAVQNNFVKRYLRFNSWSIKHLLFSDSAIENDKVTLLERILEELKGEKASFIDVKVAPSDHSLLRLLQIRCFYTVGVTANCLINFSPKFLDEVDKDRFFVRHAEDKDVSEIHELVKTSHKHNHYYYDPKIPIEQVKLLYGNLVSKTVFMENASTLVARDALGNLKGTITYKTTPALSKFLSKNLASLDFIAVERSERCQGLGDILNRIALKKMYEKSIDTVMVRTLVSNYQALGVLRKLDMKVTSSDIILHKWV